MKPPQRRFFVTKILITVLPLYVIVGLAVMINPAANNTIKISSSAFSENGFVPVKYSCKGKNVNPPLEISNAPEAAQSLTIIMEDPDAPNGTYTHWVIWNISPKTSNIDGGKVPEKAVIGSNDASSPKYSGPCPPSGTHRYFFIVSALDTILDLSPNSGKNELEKSMHGHILEQSELMAKFSKQ